MPRKKIEDYMSTEMRIKNYITKIHVLLDLLSEQRQELWEFIRKSGYSKLLPREKKVLRMRVKDRMSREEVGKEFGVTRERIRQWETKAFEKLENN